MSHLRYLLLLVGCLAALLSASAVERSLADMADTLEYNLRRYGNEIDNRRIRIGDLLHGRDSMEVSPERLELSRSLARSYLDLNLDSAVMFYRIARREALEMNLADTAKRIDMQLISIYPRQGMVSEAIDEFRAIDPSTLNRDMRRDYWDTAADLYYNIMIHYPLGEYRDKYRLLTVTALDSLLRYCDVGSDVARFSEAMLYSLQGEQSLAAAQLIEALPRLNDSPLLKARALEMLSDYYANRPAYAERHLELMIDRCNFALAEGLVEPALFAETGRLLYEAGRKELGRSLIAYAFSIGEKLSGPYQVFDRARYAQYIVNKLSVQRTWLIVTVLLLVIVIAMLLMRIVRHRREIVRLNGEIATLNERIDLIIRDNQIAGHCLITLAFLSSEQVREFNLYVLRKIKSGQVKDLCDEVESGRYLAAQNEKFFTELDTLFLDSFPDFIEKLNALFVPGRELSLLPGKRLSPELRIAAFMRLGINDSTRLAKLLNLSLNTIYTYRNRLKGRAAKREDFEKNIQIMINTP